jgi:hypothetical protein
MIAGLNSETGSGDGFFQLSAAGQRRVAVYDGLLVLKVYFRMAHSRELKECVLELEGVLNSVRG